MFKYGRIDATWQIKQTILHKVLVRTCYNDDYNVDIENPHLFFVSKGISDNVIQINRFSAFGSKVLHTLHRFPIRVCQNISQINFDTDSKIKEDNAKKNFWLFFMAGDVKQPGRLLERILFPNVSLSLPEWPLLCTHCVHMVSSLERYPSYNFDVNFQKYWRHMERRLSNSHVHDFCNVCCCWLLTKGKKNLCSHDGVCVYVCVRLWHSISGWETLLCFRLYLYLVDIPYWEEEP